jgi:hypothetical protein
VKPTQIRLCLPPLLFLCLAQTTLAAEAPKLPNPRWRVQVLIYPKVQMKWTDANGAHDVSTEMTASEIDRSISASKRFFEVDVPALNSGQMLPLLTISIKSAPLIRLAPPDCFWPDPGAVQADLAPTQYDASILIWKDDGWDQIQRRFVSLACYGGLAWPRGTGQTYATFLLKMFSLEQRNVFKHEWGHSILFYYDSSGTAPRPAVNNHINDTNTRYLSCHSRQPYILLDDSDTSPIPNSIYYNLSGFTHDYYSGLTATADQPDRCLGLNAATWASGGPVTRPIQRPGDLNADFKVDSADLRTLFLSLGTLTAPNDPRDLDYDGKITVLDMRRLVTFCTKPNCTN